MYDVSIARSAGKEIRQLHPDVIARILAAIRQLADTPRPVGCKKLAGASNRWRIRVGDYRIVYSIDDRASALVVLIVRHRSAAYE